MENQVIMSEPEDRSSNTLNNETRNKIREFRNSKSKKNIFLMLFVVDLLIGIVSFVDASVFNSFSVAFRITVPSLILAPLLFLGYVISGMIESKQYSIFKKNIFLALFIVTILIGLVSLEAASVFHSYFVAFLITVPSLISAPLLFLGYVISGMIESKQYSMFKKKIFLALFIVNLLIGIIVLILIAIDFLEVADVFQFHNYFVAYLIVVTSVMLAPLLLLGYWTPDMIESKQYGVSPPMSRKGLYLKIFLFLLTILLFAYVLYVIVVSLLWIH